MQLQENVILAPYTSYKIGGPARYFVVAKTAEDVKEAETWAKTNNQQMFMLGGGSNILISDNGFNGLVVKLDLNKIEFNDTEATVGAGANLTLLMNESLSKGLTGLEFAAGIPGTVGGAVRGNAGTYGVGMSDVTEEITYLDENLAVRTMLGSQAGWQYRHSIFKEHPWIILEVKIRLQRGDVAASRQLIKERLIYRKDRHPNEPSCGCVFKNISFDEVDTEDLKRRGLAIEQFAQHRKIPTGWLIEQAGLAGKQIGQAKISEKHANYIINLGNAKAEEVVILMSLIKQQIRDKYGIQLQEEVQTLL